LFFICFIILLFFIFLFGAKFLVREELEKAQKGEQEQTKKEEQEGQQSKPSASVKHPQCMTHRINNQCELARLMMRCK